MPSHTDLPLEVLENIIHRIDEAKDLLYFALTNKYFSQVIIPSHLQFRKIRCLTNSTVIWSKLAGHPHLCARVREIHLYESSESLSSEWETWRSQDKFPSNSILPTALLEGSSSNFKELWLQVPRINWETDTQISWIQKTLVRLRKQVLGGSRHATLPPPVLAPPVELFSTKVSISSLSKILPLVQNLTKISLILLSPWSVSAVALKDVLDSLVCYSSCHLREIVIVWLESSIDTEVFSSVRYTIRIVKFQIPELSQLWMLSNLTLFHLDLDHYYLDHDNYDGLFNLLVNRCPCLESLGLRFNLNFDLGENLWKRGTWRHLRSLSIGDCCVSFSDPVKEGEDLLKDFIARHPELECLECKDVRPGLVFDLLKNLRALSMSGALWCHDTLPPVPHLHTFEKLKYLMLENERRIGIFTSAYFPSLRVLIISHTLFIFGTSSFFPETLERLCISFSSNVGSRTRLGWTVSTP